MGPVNREEEEGEDPKTHKGIFLNIKILKIEESKLTFLINEVDTAFVNSLRRAIITEVPTMVIEDIFYFDNSSLVPDEVLALRVGLLPLTTDLENYVLPEDCDCQAELGCPKCRAILTLDVEAEDETRTVYSGDLVPGDPEIRPVNQGIPLSKLAPGQAIRFEAYAQLGRGKEHTKWSPVSQATYQNTVNLNIDPESANICVEACPDGAMITEDGQLKILSIQAFRNCSQCLPLYPKSHEELKESIQPDEFLFTLEGHGGLPPKRILIEAVNQLNLKLTELSGKLERGEIHEEIIFFQSEQEESRRLYTIGSGEYEEEEGEEESEGAAEPLDVGEEPREI
jgi:DNA-directed RNA polymerase subunit D